jgi:hypothetical protein
MNEKQKHGERRTASTAAIHPERHMFLNFTLSKCWSSPKSHGSFLILEILLLEMTIGLAGRSVGSKGQALRNSRINLEVGSGQSWPLFKQKLLNFHGHTKKKKYILVPC